MTLLIGCDEAGYGPNFGPLCIGATAWQVKAEAGKRKHTKKLATSATTNVIKVIAVAEDLSEPRVNGFWLAVQVEFPDRFFCNSIDSIGSTNSP